jgi:hypothetical protein
MATGAADIAGPLGVFGKRCAMAAIESKLVITTNAAVIVFMTVTLVMGKIRWWA